MQEISSLYYSSQGAGMPVVLLHGFPLDRRIWTSVSKSLSSKYRIITPDLPGFGNSTTSKPFTIESLADTVHQFLNELSLIPCVLGGLSMGGYTALAYVKKYPSTLKGLILIDTRAEEDPPQGKLNRDAMISLVQSKGATAVADQMLPKLLGPNPSAEVKAELKSIMDACPAKTIEYALAAMRDRADQVSSLPSISVPTQIIVGDKDSITPLAMAETMHRGIRGSTLSIIKDAGHMTTMEQPDQVSDAIGTFLSQLE